MFIFNSQKYIEEFDFDFIFFNNAATTPIPKSVSNKLINHLSPIYTPTRGGKIDALYKVEEVRERIAKLIGANHDEIVFTNGFTSAFNILINTIICKQLYRELNFQNVISSTIEHNSVFLPLSRLSKTIGVPLIKLEESALLSGNIYASALLTLPLVCNFTGQYFNCKEIFQRYSSSLRILDCSQGFFTENINVQDLNCDIAIFSAHKLLGLTGFGFMFVSHSARKYLFLSNHAALSGGGTLSYLDNNDIMYKDFPYCVEAGTLPVVQILSFLDTLDFIDKIGIEKLREDTIQISNFLYSKLKTIKGVTPVLTELHSNIISLRIGGKLHIHDIEDLLYKNHIYIRSGVMCNHLAYASIGKVVRFSPLFFNSIEQVNIVINLLNNIEFSDQII